MFVHYRSRCLILKSIGRGESGRSFTVYSEDFGKLDVVGKGIRKIASKLRGGINLFSLAEVEFIQGKREKILTDSILLKDFEDLKRDLKKLRIAYKISDIFNNLIKGQEKDEKIWALLCDVFERLNKASSFNDSVLIYYFFFWNIVSVLGYKPELYKCSLCQRKLIPFETYFNSENGELACRLCGENENFIKQVDSGSIKVIRLILDNKWPVLKRLKLGKEELKHLKRTSDFYYLYLKSK